MRSDYSNPAAEPWWEQYQEWAEVEERIAFPVIRREVGW